MSALEPRMPVMQTYRYQPLDDGPLQTRLLVIQPARSGDAPLRCRVVNHELEDPYQQADCYDALSYAWGSSELVQRMWIDDDIVLPITQNLYEALIHIRHRSLERFLWADAVCIDQSNDREKERQIMIMRRIYAHAQCVIVWLGVEANESTVALNTIREASFEADSDFTATSDELKSLEALISRPWFRRIWILQEVEAAQNVRVLCGRTELDKQAFNVGLKVLFTRKQEQVCDPILRPFESSIVSLTLVMRSSGYKSSPFGKERPSLGQLLDIFRDRESTRMHDQVYALLGMSKESDEGTGIRPDYGKPWFEVQKEVLRSIVGPQLRAHFDSVTGCLVVQSSGCVTGRIRVVQRPSTLGDHQQVIIEWLDRGESGFVSGSLLASNTYKLSVGAEVKKGDVICQLSGTRHPIIARPRCTHLEIIRIDPVVLEDSLSFMLDPSIGPYSIRLTWYCGLHENMEDYKEIVTLEPGFTNLIQFPSDAILKPEREHPTLEGVQLLIDHMLLLRDSGSHLAWECLDHDLSRLLEIVDPHQTQDPNYSRATLQRTMSLLNEIPFRPHMQTLDGGAEETLIPHSLGRNNADLSNLASNIVHTLRIAIEKMVLRDVMCQNHEWNLLYWAVLAEHEGILRRVLREQFEDPDHSHAYEKCRDEALAEAALRGSLNVVETLCELLDFSESHLQRALNLACFSNHIEIIKMLLQKGAQIDKLGRYQTTNGYLLRNRQMVPGITNLDQLTRLEYTPLRLAVEGGHMTIVKFLLERGARSQIRNHDLRDRHRMNKSVNTRDTPSDTPRVAALRIGNPEIISLLKRYATREAEADREMAAAHVTNGITS